MILWRFTEIVVYINNLSIFIKFHFMYFTKWMCHNLFSHSPADGHLDFSPLFTITRKVAIHIYVQILLEYSFFSLQDNYLGVQFLGNMVVIYLVLWETRKMFFRVPVTFYILTSNVWVIQLLYIFASIWCCHYFYFRHPNKFIVKYLCGFNLYSLMMNCVQHLFMCLFVIYSDLLQ